MAIVPNVDSPPRATYVEGVDLDAAEMNVLTDGVWSFDWTPDFASSDTTSRLLCHFTASSGATNNGGIRHQTNNLYVTDGNLATQVTIGLTFSAFQAMHVKVDTVNGEITISGATTGNGVHATASAPFSFGNDTTEVTFGARYNGTNPADGLYQNIIDESAPGRTADLSVTLDAATVGSGASAEVNASLSATLGDATVAAAGAVHVSASAGVQLADATAEAAGSVPVSAVLGVELEAATVQASGTTREAAHADLSVLLDDATASGDATVHVAGSVSASLEAATVAATGSARVLAAVAMSLGDATVSSGAAVPITCAAGIQLAEAVVVASGRTVAFSTPAERIMRVVRENRVEPVTGEARTEAVAPESRRMAA